MQLLDGIWMGEDMMFLEGAYFLRVCPNPQNWPRSRRPPLCSPRPHFEDVGQDSQTLEILKGSSADPHYPSEASRSRDKAGPFKFCTIHCTHRICLP